MHKHNTCLSVIAFAMLLVFSMIFTVYFKLYLDRNEPTVSTDNILLLVIFATVVLFAIYLVTYHTQLLNDGRKQKQLFWLLFIIVTLLCLYLIVGTDGRPNSDAMHVSDIVNEFLSGDYSQLSEIGSYLFNCPHQLGYVAAEQFISYFVGADNYFVYELINLVSILVALLLINRIATETFENIIVTEITTILCFGMIYLYIYSTYFYGDIWSLAPELASIYFVIKYIKNEYVRYPIFAGLSIGLACILKSNCQIALIAECIVLVLYLLRNFSYKDYKMCTRTMLAVICIVVISIGMKSTLEYGYKKAAGLDSMPKGIPNACYIAMGLHENGFYSGWYDNSNWNFYSDNNYDWDAADAAAKKDIANTLSSWAKRPWHGAKVLLQKSISMWADPTCGSLHELEFTGRHSDDRSGFVMSLTYGTGRTVASWIMNVWQTIVYLGTFIYCLFAFKHRKEVKLYQILPLLFILGGIMFLMIWEANSRATVRYMNVMVIYAAFGIDKMLSGIHSKSQINH